MIRSVAVALLALALRLADHLASGAPGADVRVATPASAPAALR